MKSIKTLAFASLVAVSTLAFTSCDNKKAEGTTDTDTTNVIIDETLINETVDDASNMMEAVVDSTAAGMEAAIDSTEAVIEEATTTEEEAAN